MKDLVSKQLKLKKYVRVQKFQRQVTRIGGADVAVKGNKLTGCIVSLSFPDLSVIEFACCSLTPSIPYVPGFLSFRELPVLTECFNKLKKKPDILLVDGQGIAHPRELGLAAHLGIVLNISTIGCAKSRLIGEYRNPAPKKESFSELSFHGRRIGWVVRTRDNVKPVFVSPGHLVSFHDCLKYTLAAVTKYRLPEPIRQAHKKAGDKARREDV